MTKWQNRKLSKRLLTNVFTCYRAANDKDRAEGLGWYQNAHNYGKTLAKRHNVTLSKTLGVIAALSPGREWNKNKEDADRLINAYVNNQSLPLVGTYGRRNVDKAKRILQGEKPLNVLGGPKVKTFYQSMLNPKNKTTVVIDRHAKSALLGKRIKESDVVRPYQYEWYADHYRTAAEQLNMLANQVQAVCWVTWKRLDGNLANA